MTRGFVLGVAAAVLAIPALAQEASPVRPANLAFLDHVRNARLLAADDLAGRNLADCSMPPQSAAPAGEPVVAPPTRVFDQLYYLGMNSVASWALVTSGGIIQIDSLDNAEEAQRIIVGGYRKLGLDPERMKYLVLTHGHGRSLWRRQVPAGHLSPTRADERGRLGYGCEDEAAAELWPPAGARY